MSGPRRNVSQESAQERFRPVGHGDLPVFRQDRPPQAWFYAPGTLLLVPQEQADVLERELAACPVGDNGLRAHKPAANNPGDNCPSAVLLHKAARAQQSWMELQSRPYSPVCLTLYLHNACSLSCGYCYSATASREPPPGAGRLSIGAVRAAAMIVAANCQERGLPLTVVFHGGGEPTLDQPLADRALDVVEEIAAHFDLGVFRYIATNGVMAEAKAAWIARRFDRIGLSCDGPEEIQSRQRPLGNGVSSTPLVERTARIVYEMGKPLHVRATITPQGMDRQAEIAGYLCQALHAQEIHVEPVFLAGRAGRDESFQRNQAEDFVRAYLEARQVAHSFGVRWLTSGSRPGEIHGPYCHVLRDVLNLVPGEEATGCFKVSTREDNRAQAFRAGFLQKSSGEFLLEQDTLERQRRLATALPAACQSCFNRYHCARSCPEACLLEGMENAGPVEAGFRCRFQSRLAEALIEETAQALQAHLNRDGFAAGSVLS